MRKGVEEGKYSPIKWANLDFEKGDVTFGREDGTDGAIPNKVGHSPLSLLVGLVFEQQLRNTRGSLMKPLSPREIEVLGLSLSGMQNQAIAEQLVLSIKTVETHKAHLRNKMGPQLDELRRQIAVGVVLGLETLTKPDEEIRILGFAYERKIARPKDPTFTISEVTEATGETEGVISYRTGLLIKKNQIVRVIVPRRDRHILHQITEQGQRRYEQEAL